MRLRLIATAAVLALPPIAAEASDICQALQLRLATLPQVLGSTAEVRWHAEALRRNSDEIRYLRTEMRRSRCGNGSIVTYGQRDDVCSEMSAALRDMEIERDAILAQRSAARGIVRPSGERNAILAALNANQCGTGDIPAPTPAAVEPQGGQQSGGMREPSTSITTLAPKAETAPPALSQPDAPPPPPERDYDPSRKIRSVGPVFLPDEPAIDLATPATDGAHPRQ